VRYQAQSPLFEVRNSPIATFASVETLTLYRLRILRIVLRSSPVSLLACVALTAAAFGRFLPFFLSSGTKHSPAAFVFAGWLTLYAGVDLLILLAIARDLVVTRQIHPVYAYGLSVFVICQTFVMYTVFHHSAWWLRTAQAILG